MAEFTFPNSGAVKIGGRMNFGVFAGGAPAFSPLSIPSLKFGIEARNLALANNAAVASWSDITSNHYDAAQATAGQRPTFRNDLYSFPAVRFDGANDCMVTPSIDLTAANKLHQFVLCKLIGAPAAFGILNESSANFGSNVSTFVSYIYPDGTIEAGNHNDTDNSASYADSNPAFAATFKLLEITIDRTLASNEVSIYKNGVLDVAGRPLDANTSGNFGNYPLFIGGRNQASNFLQYDLVGEWFFGDILAGANLSNMRTYRGKLANIAL